METIISLQAAALGIGAVLGLLLGLLYDIVRPPRRRAAPIPAAVIDLVYGFSAGISVFIYIMAAPGGRLGLWELSAVLLGFLLYTWLLSDICYGFTDAVYILICRSLSIAENNMKKIRDMTKLFFQNMRK